MPNGIRMITQSQSSGKKQKDPNAEIYGLTVL